MPVLSASDLHSAPKRHRAQQEESQGPLPRADSVQRHHSKLSSFQSPRGNQAKGPSRILKVGKRSQWTPSRLVGRLADPPPGGWAPGLRVPLESPPPPRVTFPFLTKLSPGQAHSSYYSEMHEQCPIMH